MKQVNWAYCRSLLRLLLLCLLCTGAQAQVLRPLQAETVFTDSDNPPPAAAPWQVVDLPYSSDQPVAWYRIRFEAPDSTAESWAIYLPYLVGGGRLLLNGELITHIPEPSPTKVIRWLRPHLVLIPAGLLHAGRNELLLRIPMEPVARRGRIPLLAIGPQDQVLSEYDKRLFWVRTMSQFSALGTWIVGPLVLLIWWRRREEVLYGLFGLAALLWGVRTLNLVIEVLPAEWWTAWRFVYHSASGGFAIVLMIFLLRLANLRKPQLEKVLAFYWMLGPVAFLLSGGSEWIVGRLWMAGLIPICLSSLGWALWRCWHRRTIELMAMIGAIAVTVAAGLHDFMVHTTAPLLQVIAPQLAANRLFMLHYAADLMLLVMGGILCARFISTLESLALLNRTLESRVAEREQSLVEKYTQVGQLERRLAADEERQRITRDLHDGLGSQLFVTLSRLESGHIGHEETVQTLRECISDMRLTLDAMSPEDNDFLMAWGNFRFRWERQLMSAGIASTWRIEPEDAMIELAPHSGLQWLRIAQEALTNVLKHAGAKGVTVLLKRHASSIRIEISDDGKGPGSEGRGTGRGLINMRVRAQRLGASMGIDAMNPGTRVWVEYALDKDAVDESRTANAV